MYRVLKDGEIVESAIPGKYAGWRPGKIFGRLDCKSGMRMMKENRVFFLTLEDAVKAGYRPCKKCRPISEEEFAKIRHLVPQYKILEEFYNRS
jgi:methylphosphotriester-DNA--protein-cysteine methyltransferase